jgi:adenosine deaminase
VIAPDSAELGVDPLDFAPAYALARTAGLRLTGHQGENTPASFIATLLDQLGVERVDHGLSVLGDDELVARMAGERIPLTVCPTSNVLIANAFPQLSDHPLMTMRAAGLLATVNTDDPAMTDLDLGKEYAAVAEAFGLDWDAMVGIALDGVEATWLDDDDKRALRARVFDAGAALRPSIRTGVFA